MKYDDSKQSNKGLSRFLIAICVILVALVIVFANLLSNAQSELSKVRSEIRQKDEEINKLKNQLVIMAENIDDSENSVPPTYRTIEDSIEPDNSLVRDTALVVVADVPVFGQSNDEIWKIWQINNWVRNYISYVSDPQGREYYALAHETMLTKSGDCEDIAILAASMFEAVGLDAGLILVDTDNDEIPDHMACVVYYPGDTATYLHEEEALMEYLNVASITGEIQVLNLGKDITDYSNSVWDLKYKYESGIWVVIDPVASDIPGYLDNDDGTYDIIDAMDAGE